MEVPPVKISHGLDEDNFIPMSCYKKIIRACILFYLNYFYSGCDLFIFPKWN